MEPDCCSQSFESSGTRCPVSNGRGVPVSDLTVKALLTDRALCRLESAPLRFCPDPHCRVVYFDAAGRCFLTTEIRVPVWQKEPCGDRPICYCFGESEASIRGEIATSGRSMAVDRVRGHIDAGRCACEVRNPRGACCLGDLIAAVRRVGSSNPA
jgi:hypothetical protein